MSIICVMRSMPSVVTFSAWVSPRLNSAEPCARGRTPTSAESGRMSVADRPSSRTPSSITRLRMTFFCNCFHAGPNSDARAANASSPSVSATWVRVSSLSALERLLARDLVGQDRRRQPVLREAGHQLVQVLAEQRRGHERPGRDVDLLEELELHLDDLGDRALGGLEALRDDALGRGGGALREQRPGVVGRLPLDHQDVDLAGVVAAAGDDHVERGLLGLLERGVHDPLVVDQGHAHRSDGTVERQAGDAGGERRPVHGGDVVGVLPVDAQDRDDDLDLVAVALAERRPQRPVDQPAREDRRLRRPPFTAEEAAGDLAGGVHALLDVDREREEVDALAGLRAHAGREDRGLSVRHDGGAVRLERELARLERQVPVPEGPGAVVDGHGPFPPC